MIHSIIVEYLCHSVYSLRQDVVRIVVRRIVQIEDIGSAGYVYDGIYVPIRVIAVRPGNPVRQVLVL